MQHVDQRLWARLPPQRQHAPLQPPHRLRPWVRAARKGRQRSQRQRAQCALLLRSRPRCLRVPLGRHPLLPQAPGQHRLGQIEGLAVLQPHQQPSQERLQLGPPRRPSQLRQAKQGVGGMPAAQLAPLASQLTGPLHHIGQYGCVNEGLLPLLLRRPRQLAPAQQRVSCALRLELPSVGAQCRLPALKVIGTQAPEAVGGAGEGHQRPGIAAGQVGQRGPDHDPGGLPICRGQTGFPLPPWRVTRRGEPGRILGRILPPCQLHHAIQGLGQTPDLHLPQPTLPGLGSGSRPLHQLRYGCHAGCCPDGPWGQQSCRRGVPLHIPCGAPIHVAPACSPVAGWLLCGGNCAAGGGSLPPPLGSVLRPCLGWVPHHGHA